jgi:hypothetical protein
MPVRKEHPLRRRGVARLTRICILLAVALVIAIVNGWIVEAAVVGGLVALYALWLGILVFGGRGPSKSSE